MSSVISPERSSSSQEQNIRRLSARCGVPFRIHLWEDRTRGELWVPSYDSTHLVMLGDDYLRIASGNAVDTGRRTFEFKPIAVGTHRVVFEKRLGWKFTAEDRHVYDIVVAAAPSPGVC